MAIIVLLIFISISIAVLFLAIFFWSIRSGQYDDTATPAIRMVFEDNKPLREAGTTKEPLTKISPGTDQQQNASKA